MDQKKLALLGGEPVRKKPFSLRQTIAEKETKAAMDVMKKGDLSLFFGSPGEYFLGGPEVRGFEQKWAKKYGYKHGISVNSWTTGLMTAIGAVGVEPGDEVLCTPYSMSATSTSILFYGGIPVFVDIEPDTFNIDPAKLEEKITPRTRAIMLVHLFGHPANMDAIMKIARKHNLKVIEDAAHAPGAKYKGKYVGALGDIGGFSLNYHKHIHTGEGGLLVTNDDDLAQRSQLIRNHGENSIEALKLKDISNVIGANYRMTEFQAAIGNVQMDLIEGYLEHRNKLASHFSKRIAEFEGFTPPRIEADCTHSFYVYAIKYDQNVYGVSRSKLVEAINAELPEADHWERVGMIEGYVRPLYWNQVYQQKIAIGRKGFPWNMNPQVKYDYSKGLCPVVERMHEKELIYTPLIREAVNQEDLDEVLRAVEKVVTGIDQLRKA